MKILEKLENTSVAVVLDTHKAGQLGAQIQNLAVKAISKGVGTPEWISYMSLFADNKAQLERLTVPKDGEDTYFPVGRAYVAANGTCGPDTNTKTGNGVKTLLEADLTSSEPDQSVVDPPGPNPVPPGTVVRPIVIPIIPKA